MYPISFATYHAIYGVCTATSAPTIAFVLISPVHTGKKGQTEYTPPHTSHFVPLPHAHTHTSPPHLHFGPTLALWPTLALCPMLALCTVLTLFTMLTLAPHPPLHSPICSHT